MAARVILTPRPNSHPFQERTVTLEQPLKIGRSVARSRPASNNAIFDCKVLSRNHALLFFEGGKFYIQDTKSSNGTFVNNVRLSKSSEESPKAQISSGDVVQFGVEVIEVNKKVTHGCIVANLTLFVDGKEVKFTQNSEKTPRASLQDIYTLNNYLRESEEREVKLESKLTEIKKVIRNTAEGVKSGWKTLIEEDRLLTRIDILERQLQASHKGMNDDRLREEVIQLNKDKEKYQEAAKEALRKSLTDKLEVIKKCHELERNLNTKEGDHKLLMERSSQLSKELDNLVVKYEDSERKCDEVQQVNLKYKEDIEALNQALKDEQHLVLHKDDIIQCLQSKQGSAHSSPTSNMELELKLELNHNNDNFDPCNKSPNYQENETITHISGIELSQELNKLRDRIMNEDELREKLVQLIQDKAKYQETTKEALRKSLADKLELIKKCQDLERTLNVKDDEHKQLSNEMELLASKYEESERKLKDSREAAIKYKEEIEVLNGKLNNGQHIVLKPQPSSSEINHEPSYNRELINSIANSPDRQGIEVVMENELRGEGRTKENDGKDLRLNTSFGYLNISANEQDLSFKLYELEEELATFKDRYATSTTECSILSRKLKEKEAQEEPFYMQPGFLILFFSIIFLLALIALSSWSSSH